jgi:hypothetical protein
MTPARGRVLKTLPARPWCRMFFDNLTLRLAGKRGPSRVSEGPGAKGLPPFPVTSTILVRPWSRGLLAGNGVSFG